MKHKLYLPLIALLFIGSCTQAKEEQQVKQEQQVQQAKQKQEVSHYKYTGKIKKTYFASYNFSGHFDVIFNGVIMTRNRKDGVTSGIEDLNPYIAKKGPQKVTLILRPLDAKSKIAPEDVKDYFIDIVYTEDGDPSAVHKVKRCSFPAVYKPVDSLVYTWTFDADVPYELTGFTNSSDLSSEDPKPLLAEVLEYYKHVHEVINKGDAKDYLQLYQKSREREMISMYMDEQKQKEYLQKLEKRISSSKGFMQPLEDYRLLIHPNGRLISLIKPDGTSPLYSKDSEGKWKRYGLDLHRVKGSHKFEVY